MNNLRRFCVAAVIALTLTIPAFAGEIDTTLAPPPAHAATTQGQIDTLVTGQVEETTAATDSVVQIALNLLQSVLALF